MSDRHSDLSSRIILIIVTLCVMVGLPPATDFDFDGSVESFLTEGDLLVSSHSAFGLQDSLLSQSQAAYCNIAQPPFTFLFVPPPIASI